MSTLIAITIHDDAIHPTELYYEYDRTDPDLDPQVSFREGLSSVNRHPDVISACEELEDHLCRIITRMRENEDYIAPVYRVKEVA